MINCARTSMSFINIWVALFHLHSEKDAEKHLQLLSLLNTVD